MASIIEEAETSPMFDFGAIEDLDPSLGNGYRVVYEREIPFEVRNSPSAAEGRQQGTLELIKVKILVLGAESAPIAIQLEMCSEADLFFHYGHKVEEKDFHIIQEKQKLMIDFADYSAVLIRMLNNCIKEPHIHLAIFTMVNEFDARLDFIQNMEYKFVELMYCICVRSPDEIIQHHITYRYNAMKHKLNVMHARLQEINNLVKVKNPSLLLQLQKNALVGPSSGGGNSSGGNHSSSLRHVK